VALLVWSQLDLFTHGALAPTRSAGAPPRGPRLCKMNDRERDDRSGGQWLRATKAYLEFGTGDAWRRLSDPEQRNSPERAWYLAGIRTMNGIAVLLRNDAKILQIGATRSAGTPAAAAPRVPSSPAKVSPAARLMAARSRGWIVDELLRVNPALTDKKLLLRLSHIKLAGMLLEARSRQRRVGSASRPAAKKEVRRILPKPPKSVVPVRGFPAPLRGAA
jgi:hypothetical protein